MSETSKKKKLLVWCRRVLLVLVLITLVLLSVFMLAYYAAGRQLGAEIVKINKAGEPLTFSALSDELNLGDTGQDASSYYIEVLGGGISPDDMKNAMRINVVCRSEILSAPAKQFPDELREKIDQSLVKLQPSLEKLDEAANLPLSGFDMGIEQGMRVYQTRLRRVQTAVSLLSLRTLNLIVRAEDEAAVNSAISMLKMTRVFDFHPTIFLQGAKAECVALACEDIRLLLERCRSSDESLAMLQKALSGTIPDNALERMFLAERIYQIETVRNLMPKSVALRFLQSEVPDSPERLPSPSSHWALLRARQELARYFRDMAWLVAVSRRPWPEPLDATVGYLSDSVERRSELLSTGAGFIQSNAKILAFMRCNVLAIAVERYRRSNGRLPESLDDLLPDYTYSIPLDPFTGKKLLYSYDEGSYVVYSVDINRQDDGGSVTFEADGKKQQDCGLRIYFGKPK